MGAQSQCSDNPRVERGGKKGDAEDVWQPTLTMTLPECHEPHQPQEARSWRQAEAPEEGIIDLIFLKKKVFDRSSSLKFCPEKAHYLTPTPTPQTFKYYFRLSTVLGVSWAGRVGSFVGFIWDLSCSLLTMADEACLVSQQVASHTQSTSEKLG